MRQSRQIRWSAYFMRVAGLEESSSIEGVNPEIVAQNECAEIIGNIILQSNHRSFVGKTAAEHGDYFLIRGKMHLLRNLGGGRDHAQIQKLCAGSLPKTLDLLVKGFIRPDRIGMLLRGSNKSPFTCLTGQPPLLNQFRNSLAYGGSADLIIFNQFIFSGNRIPNRKEMVLDIV